MSILSFLHFFFPIKELEARAGIDPASSFAGDLIDQVRLPAPLPAKSGDLEARAGIEPAYKVLQTSA